MMIKTKCIICNKEFLTWPYRIRDNIKYCSRKCKGLGDRGRIGHWKGKKFSQKHRDNISNAFMGNKSNTWKGGISLNPKKYSRDYMKMRYKNDSIFRENQKESVKKWVASHKEQKNFWSKRRERIRRGAKGTHTLIEWIQLKNIYRFTCLMCKKKEPIIQLTEDHIVPLSIGGTNYINNIQPLCRSCNAKKHNKIMDFRKGWLMC